jgi:predicted kinase
MMCGIAGSGKTTCTKALEAKGFVRISIDEYIWAYFGRFGVDYPEAQYEQLQQRAEEANFRRLGTLIQERAACVLDYSFWSRAQRQQYRRFVEAAGGQVTLLYLHADLEVLRNRLQARNQTRGANAAFAIDPKMLERFAKGFEEPRDDEDGIVIVQSA